MDPPNDFYNNNISSLLRAGYKPILAHAERYVYIMQKALSCRKPDLSKIFICKPMPEALLGLYGDKR